MYVCRRRKVRVNRHRSERSRVWKSSVVMHVLRNGGDDHFVFCIHWHSEESFIGCHIDCSVEICIHPSQGMENVVFRNILSCKDSIDIRYSFIVPQLEAGVPITSPGNNPFQNMFVFCLFFCLSKAALVPAHRCNSNVRQLCNSSTS